MKQLRIVIVDDHALMVAGIRKSLESYPEFKVIGSAVNGVQAIDVVLKLRPDVVLMDVFMPGLNGLEATRQIKESLPEVKVIVISGHGTSDLLAELLRMEVSGYVMKNQPPEDLIDALKVVAHGGFYWPSEAPLTFAAASRLSAKKSDILGKIHHLTCREKQVLPHLLRGKTAKEIGQVLNISYKTVEAHRANILQKMEVKKLSELVDLIIQRGGDILMI
jgi:DNA-binding NarL/FixJ family response regulator